jgi:hypothetical protein
MRRTVKALPFASIVLVRLPARSVATHNLSIVDRDNQFTYMSVIFLDTQASLRPVHVADYVSDI